jgi:hypothetical protein
MRSLPLLFVCLLVILLTAGCGSQGSPPPPPPPAVTSVTVSPSTANLLVKAAQQFNANVQGTGSFDPSVTWFVNGVLGGNATVGTITNTGGYSAPTTVPNPANITIKAQSVQDGSKSGAAQVTINPENVQVSVSPGSGSVKLGATLQFSASVTGTVNTAVLWSVNNIVGGQPSVGFIDGSGRYTAPANLPLNPLMSISATSQEDATKSATATVTILATAGGITVTVSPQNASVIFDGSQSIQFTATVSGTSNTAVTWSIDQSFQPIGQISASGLYTPSGLNCTNAIASAVIRATSAANSGAQGLSVVNFVPPAPTLTALTPQPADAKTVVQVTGAFAVGAGLTMLYPGPNGTTIPGMVTGISSSWSSFSAPVPLGAASGPLSVQQSCISISTGIQFPNQQSNAIPFARLPRLRIRANRQVLTTGESEQMLASFLGEQTPQPITWSALFGTVTPAGVFTAGSSNWDKVTGCISGTQQCDFFVFSVVAARIEPSVAEVPTGGTIQLSEVQGGGTLSPTWTIEAGGGTLSASGLYSAPTTAQDSGAIPVMATAAAGSATDAISVVGSFPGMVNRILDYPDISANASGQTTIPMGLTVDGNRVYVLEDNLPFGVGNAHYNWIDVYDATDAAHPVWTTAVEGFDQDEDIHPMQTFASGGFLWRVTVPQITSPAGSLTTEVAFYDASNGQPVLKQLFSVPRLWEYSFYKGLLIGIPSSFTPTGQALWSQLPALVFDGRTGTIFPSQTTLSFANPAAPVTVEGIYLANQRLFLLYQQQQSDGSMPFFLATHDLTTSPPALLQTIPTQAGALSFIGSAPPPVFGNLLFLGAGVYDVSSGLPVLVAPSQTLLPSDMNGSLALVGVPHQLADYSDPVNPKIEGVLESGDDRFRVGARFVGNHAYVVGSGLQIFDASAPTGGEIPKSPLPGSGALAIINDLVVVSNNLCSAENTDVGEFVTCYDLTQTPPRKIGAFTLSNEIPFSLAATGHFLFVGTSTELVVLDVSNPASPAKVGSLALPTSTLVLVGSVLYAGTTDKHLVAINVANPAAPVAGVSISLAGFPVILRASGNLLLIAADTAGLLTYSIANPAAPTLLSQFLPSSAVEDVSVDGNLALLAAADGGFVIADITNPAAPVLAGQVPLAALDCFAALDSVDGAPGLVSISLNNGIAYLGAANMYGRVFGFDYRQPAHPRVVSSAIYGNAILESVLVFASSGSNLFVAGDMFYDDVFEADITHPRNFIRHMCFPPPFGPNAGANFPELQKRLSGPSMWNPKAHLKNYGSAH